MVVFLCTLLDKELSLYYFVLFFLQSFFDECCLSSLLGLSSSLCILFIWTFFPILHSVFVIVDSFDYCGTDGFDPQRLAMRYAFKWLCMVSMCREIGLLISGFSVESRLKSVVLVFIWMCQKSIYCCVKYCLQIWSLYVCCLNFLKYFFLSSCLYHEYICSYIIWFKLIGRTCYLIIYQIYIIT